MYKILKKLQETMEGFGQITAVGMHPASEFFACDRIEISGKTEDGDKFELNLELHAKKAEAADD